MDPRGDSSMSSGRRRSRKPQYAPSGAPLKLPPLPRFHPATYGSPNGSLSTTSSSSANSPAPPMSPRPQQWQLSEAQRQPPEPQRQLSDAQKQLYMYQRELLNQLSHGTSRTSKASKPDSPKLTPMAGSPGPVTPLELEGEGYLSAGFSQTTALDVEKLMKDEARRKREHSPRHTSRPVTSQ